VVRGLWEGISSLGSWLFNKLISFVKNNIPAPIAKALNIDSPSKVAAGLGREVPRGLAVGIAGGAPIVATQSAALAQQTIAALSDLTAPAPTFAGAVAAAGAGTGSPAPGIPGAATADGWVLHADIYLGNELLTEQTVRIVRKENRAEARKLAARPREI
jgi:hypothetical protein